MKEKASRYTNVTLHTAPMPEVFGTHHTKMMILLRHDDLAQVIIHTANMIPQDWDDMTQGVWRSPLLPLTCGSARMNQRSPATYGSGARFIPWVRTVHLAEHGRWNGEE